jgi:hypothetical protein
MGKEWGRLKDRSQMFYRTYPTAQHGRDLWTGCPQEIQHPTINPLAAYRLMAMESKGVSSGGECRNWCRTIGGCWSVYRHCSA